MSKIVIEACMDRRLVEVLKVLADVNGLPEHRRAKLDELVHEGTPTYAALHSLLDSFKSGDRVFIIANAGANIHGHTETLNAFGSIDRIVILAHTDTTDVTNGCGAMGALSQRIEQNKHDDFFKHVAGDEYLQGYQNREGIERKNPEIQAARAKEYAPEVQSILIDTHDLVLPQDTGVHLAVVADVGEGGSYVAKFNDTVRFQTYGIIGRRTDTEIDEELARSALHCQIKNRYKNKTPA